MHVCMYVCIFSHKNCYSAYSLGLMVVTCKAKEDAASSALTDSRLTHVAKYFKGTRAVKIKSAITKEH